MKGTKIEILGYFKRTRDGSEYVLFKQNGELLITNGKYIWSNYCKRIEKRYQPQLEKAGEINLEEMSNRLKENYPYAEITVEILKTLSKLVDNPPADGGAEQSSDSEI